MAPHDVRRTLFATTSADPASAPAAAVGQGAVPADDPPPDRVGAQGRALVTQRWLIDVVAIGTIALLARLLFAHAVPDTDPTFALVWGREIIHGHLPDFAQAGAPTAHPLPTAEGALAAILGRTGGPDALLVLSYVALGASVWGTFRLGQALFSWRVGVLAALLVGSNFATVDVATGAFLDAQFTALVIWAGVIEARAEGRNVTVLLILAIAALLRPEAWPLALAYWAWAVRPRGAGPRGPLLLLVGPLAWMIMDLIVTGQPFFAFTNARQSDEGVALGGADNGQLLTFAVDQLRDAMRAPVLLGGTIGLLLAVRTRWQTARVMTVALVVLLAGFAALTVLRLPVPNRMLLTPGVLLSLFCAFAVLGWLEHRPHRQRLVWGAGGLAIFCLLLATAPDELTRLKQLNQRRAGIERAVAGLRTMSLARPTPTVLTACRNLTVSAKELVPYTAYYLDWPLQDIRLAPPTIGGRGAYLVPSRPAAKVLLPFFERRRVEGIPQGYRVVGGDRSWRLYTNEC